METALFLGSRCYVGNTCSSGYGSSAISPLMVFQNPCNKLIKAAHLSASFVVPYKESVLPGDVASGKLIIVLCLLCCLMSFHARWMSLFKNVPLLCLGILLPTLSERGLVFWAAMCVIWGIGVLGKKNVVIAFLISDLTFWWFGEYIELHSIWFKAGKPF